MDTNTFSISRHEFEGVDFIENNGEFFKGCKRCGGTGHYSFNGHDSICYSCGNTAAKLGDHLGTLEQAQKWAHGVALGRAAAARKREREFQAIQDKMEAKRVALCSTDAELYHFLMSIELGGAYDSEQEYWDAEAAGNIIKRDRDAFLCSMKEQLTHGIYADRAFSERMIEASRAAMVKRQAKAAEQAANPAPSGRLVVTGEIVGTKVVEGDYGTAYKVTVKSDEGFRVYVSLAKALVDQASEGISWTPENEWFHALKGRRLAFTATLEPSRDDASFAFGSRPSKAAWI